jgi:hypothetical protein
VKFQTKSGINYTYLNCGDRLKKGYIISWRQEMQRKPFPRTVLRKAQRLVQKKAVSKIAKGVYSVKSENPDRLRVYPLYMVKRNASGDWTCTCQGYEKRGICSHSLAVIITESKSTDYPLNEIKK